MWHFAHRHPGPELMDDPKVDRDALRLNLRELETINTLLGGYQTTFHGLKRLMKKPEKTYHILDIGCGGGDTIAAVDRWAQKRKLKVRFTGLDLSPTAIEYAKERCASIERIEFLQMPFQALEGQTDKFDIAMCSLFCHHFYDQELTTLLQVMHQNSRIGFVINDLERHRIAHASITLLTRLLSKSHLVKHDAPLSVQRGFTLGEWREMLLKAGVLHVELSWQWAFRHCVIGFKG